MESAPATLQRHGRTAVSDPLASTHVLRSRDEILANVSAQSVNALEKHACGNVSIYNSLLMFENKCNLACLLSGHERKR